MGKLTKESKIAVVLIVVVLIAALASAAYVLADDNENKKKIILVIDEPDVGEGSYGELVWKGIESVSSRADVSYIADERDMKSKLDDAVSKNADIIWAVSSITPQAVLDSAKEHPAITYILVDFETEEQIDNLITLSYNSNESSFLGGCAAAFNTQSNTVGFIGGRESEVIEAFECGYKAGVLYASKIIGQEIAVQVAYANSFSDPEIGKQLGREMYQTGCDVIFQAAGSTGIGVIDVAKELDKLVIGVDTDQEYLAPDNVLTSVVKEVTKAVELVNERLLDGENLGGQNIIYDFSNGAEGVVKGNLSDEQYNKIMEIKNLIASGEIKVPYDEQSYQEFSSKD